MAIFGKKTKKETSSLQTSDTVIEPIKKVSEFVVSIKRPVLVKIHSSEKAYAAQAHRGYVFVVRDEATKQMVKNEVQKRYNVKVSKVNIVRHKGKTLRLRGGLGRRPHIKKAVVTLKEGQSIDLT